MCTWKEKRKILGENIWRNSGWNFSRFDLKKKINTQDQEAQWTLSKVNKNITPRHPILKLLKINDEEKIKSSLIKNGNYIWGNKDGKTIDFHEKFAN